MKYLIGIMKREFLGTGLALATAVVSGFAIPVNKIFVVDLDPAVFTAVRALIIGLIFLGISYWQKDFSRSEFRRLNWKYLLAIGVIGGGLAFLLYFTGLRFTTVGRGAFLHKTLPLYVTLFAYVFLKERVTRKQSLALLAMLVGLFMITVISISPAAMWADPTFGDLLIIGATILWAVENTIAKKAMIHEHSNFVVSFSRMFFGAVVLFGAVLLMGRLDALLAITPAQFGNIMISTGLLFAYVLFWYGSLRYINVSKAATLLLIAPVISLLLGVWWFGEPVPVLQIAGSALILIGAYFVTTISSEFTSGA
jgi:drug/metabolite transporter (DMT)-like permease